MDELDSLDLLELNGICFQKGFSEMSSGELSSGESQILISFLSIFSRITENSLVLIDEPELSLHPNWQMQYIEFLQMTFRNYSSCHFVLATHSHFLVSDAPGESTSICLFSRNEENLLMVESIESNTYGWSPDEVLFTIFKLKTNRNFFLQRALEKILKAISHHENKEIVRNELSSIENVVNLSDDDPLNVIIDQAKKYISE